MTFVAPIIYAITLAMAIAAALLSLFAVFDAATRRPDAFAAADKKTKGTWGGITAGCAVVAVLGYLVGGAFSVFGLLWLAALVGDLVYLLDVRPKLREVQRGSRW